MCMRACMYMGVYARPSVSEDQTKFCELSTCVLLVFHHEMLKQKDIVPNFTSWFVFVCNFISGPNEEKETCRQT